METCGFWYPLLLKSSIIILFQVGHCEKNPGQKRSSNPALRRKINLFFLKFRIQRFKIQISKPETGEYNRQKPVQYLIQVDKVEDLWQLAIEAGMPSHRLDDLQKTERERVLNILNLDENHPTSGVM